MFNDHLLFSNNLNDAANQLRNIQLQKLEEEKYKQRSIKLQEKINILENKLNYLMELKDVNLAALYMNTLSGDEDAWKEQMKDKTFKEWWLSLTQEQQRLYRESWERNMARTQPVSGPWWRFWNHDPDFHLSTGPIPDLVSRPTGVHDTTFPNNPPNI